MFRNKELPILLLTITCFVLFLPFNSTKITAIVSNDLFINTISKSYQDTNIDELNIPELPPSERNRLDKDGTWFYENRGLKDPPYLNRSQFNIVPELLPGETFDFEFGINQGVELIFTFDYYWMVDGVEQDLPSDSKGDIDLILADSYSTVLQTSTNQEGAAESITYTFTADGNYTLRILHDERDSTKSLAAGYVKITFDANNIFAPIYFEGRNIDNKPTEYSYYYDIASNWRFLVCSVIAPNSIDFYQLRVYDEMNGTLIGTDDAQSFGTDMGVQVASNIEVDCQFMEVEAEWGEGFAYVGAETLGKVVRWLNIGDTYPLGAKVLIKVGASYCNFGNAELYRGIEAIGLYQEGYGYHAYFEQEGDFLYDYGPSLFTLTYTLTKEEYHIYRKPNHGYATDLKTIYASKDYSYSHPELDNVGYIGPTPLGNYILYAKIKGDHHLLQNVTLHYNDHTKNMYHLEDGYWGFVVKNINPSSFDYTLELDYDIIEYSSENTSSDDTDSSDNGATGIGWSFSSFIGSFLGSLILFVLIRKRRKKYH